MTSDAARAWRETAEGAVLRVRLTPKGGRDAVENLSETPDGPAVRARVRAAPEDGAANAALEKLVADWLGVGRRAVTVIAGHKSRTKMVAVAGDPLTIGQTIATRVEGLEP